MREAFSVAVPVPTGSDAQEFVAEARTLFGEMLVDLGLVIDGDFTETLMPYRPVVSNPVREVETNGPDLPRPLTADGPVWLFTAYVDLV